MILFRPITKVKNGSIRSYAKYNWFDNTKRYMADANTINKRTQCDIFRYLHYMGSHAPLPVRNKWHKVERKFLNKHDPSGPYIRWTINYTLSKFL